MESPIKWILRCSSCIVVLFGWSVTVQAQTSSEWFRQKKAQQSYLLQQLIALRAYGSQLKQGYKAVSQGWQTIKGFSQGEFDLHRLYLNGLKLVNPLIAKDPRVAESLEAIIAIRLGFAALEKLELNLQHRSYVEQVRVNLMQACEKELAALESLLEKGKLEMTDDERLQRLDQIHIRLKDKEAFTRDFSAQAKLLAQQQKIQIIEIEKTRRDHGNK